MAIRKLKTLGRGYSRARDTATALPGTFTYAIDRFAVFADHAAIAGWAFDTLSKITAVELTVGSVTSVMAWPALASDDVVDVHGSLAAGSRFAGVLSLRPGAMPSDALLTFVLDDGRRMDVQDLSSAALAADPYHLLVHSFFASLHGRGKLDILEVGSRARSGVTQRNLLPADCAYTGVDIVGGENVDVVGDAHELASLLSPRRFDVAFCMSVFEHLIMPWKVVLEVNRVLRPGGLFFITTHQTFPLHDTPWDFFRFSDRAWPGLLNASTGFRIQQSAMGEPASVVAKMAHPVIFGLEGLPAFIASAVLAEKTAETELSWPVPAAPLMEGWYPG